MIDRNFEDDLKASQSEEYQDFFKRAYIKAFPDFVSMTEETDLSRQSQGIDRVINLSNGRIITTEEKLDHTKHTNFLFEYECITDKNTTPGWMNKKLLCDFLVIGYSHPNHNRCYIFSYPILYRVWVHYHNKWIDKGKSKRSGFRIAKKTNESKWGVYTTFAVCVPQSTLLSAYNNANIITNR